MVGTPVSDDGKHNCACAPAAVSHRARVPKLKSKGSSHPLIAVAIYCHHRVAHELLRRMQKRRFSHLCSLSSTAVFSEQLLPHLHDRAKERIGRPPQFIGSAGCDDGASRRADDDGRGRSSSSRSVLGSPRAAAQRKPVMGELLLERHGFCYLRLPPPRRLGSCRLPRSEVGLHFPPSARRDGKPEKRVEKTCVGDVEEARPSTRTTPQPPAARTCDTEALCERLRTRMMELRGDSHHSMSSRE